MLHLLAVFGNTSNFKLQRKMVIIENYLQSSEKKLHPAYSKKCQPTPIQSPQGPLESTWYCSTNRVQMHLILPSVFLPCYWHIKRKQYNSYQKTVKLILRTPQQILKFDIVKSKGHSHKQTCWAHSTLGSCFGKRSSQVSKFINLFSNLMLNNM